LSRAPRLVTARDFAWDFVLAALGTVVVVLIGGAVWALLGVLLAVGAAAIIATFLARSPLRRLGRDPAEIIFHVLVVTGLTALAVGFAALECLTC
jgi:hypothetical protein